MNIYNLPETKEKRKLLRQNQTETEKLLWDNVRNRKLKGYKFFRQYGIGQYIADFYCPKVKLVIELDGNQHLRDDDLEYDKEREKFMNSFEIKTIRFNNSDILNSIYDVIEEIKMELEALEKRG